MDIGRRIRELREERGLSQDELARRLGVHPQSLWRYEHGERNLSASKIKEVATALNVEPGELFENPLAKAR